MCHPKLTYTSRNRASALLSVLCAGLLLPIVLRAEPVSSGQIDRYREALSATLAAQAQSALARIEEAPRQLLALRSYLRAGERLPARWSWSAEQIEAFGRTREYRQLVEDVERVRSRFEKHNPGYTLYANTDVRSLDAQIERWNANRSVGAVAQAIDRAVRREMLRSDYPARPNAAAVERLATFLRRWRPSRAAALAAPGLSLHGQLRAIDFAVFKDGEIVAPTNLAAAQSVWERQGWSTKLKRATAGTRFVGPLQSPHEPWHYEYEGPERTMNVAAD